VPPPLIAPRPSSRPRARRGTASSGGDGQALYAALQYLLRSFQSRDREKPCYFDLSIGECHALEAVVRKGPIRVGDLAATLRLDKSGASRMARSLEDRGYVKRGPHPGDGRAVALSATLRGAQLEARIQKSLLRRYARAVRGFGLETRRALPRALRALADAAARPDEAPLRK
jgi:MarR family transcriptional regulator, 2-MHQ and catechol-resistance regulon repressor